MADRKVCGTIDTIHRHTARSLDATVILPTTAVSSLSGHGGAPPLDRRTTFRQLLPDRVGYSTWRRVDRRFQRPSCSGGPIKVALREG